MKQLKLLQEAFGGQCPILMSSPASPDPDNPIKKQLNTVLIVYNIVIIWFLIEYYYFAAVRRIAL